MYRTITTVGLRLTIRCILDNGDPISQRFICISNTMNISDNNFPIAVKWILHSSRTVAFTGAGISVESGIPPFRGENGLWNTYNPIFLDINYFHQNPQESWRLIKEIFYDFFGSAKPNGAHYALARMEKANLLQSVITQNIDSLHQCAGSEVVHEFHGSSRNLRCESCFKTFPAVTFDFSILPPKCPQCGRYLKPDFVFFGEPIPEEVCTYSFSEATIAELFILIGTTGEVTPASYIPFEAKKNGKKIIEVNIRPSHYTHSITDIFLCGKATEVLLKLAEMSGSPQLLPK